MPTTNLDIVKFEYDRNYRYILRFRPYFMGF